MERIERPQVKMIMREAGVALDGLLVTHGLAIEHVGASYTPESITLKIRLVLGNVTSEERLRREFEALAGLFGVTATDFGAVVKVAGQEFRLVGFKTRASRFPVLGDRISDGKRYKLPMSCLGQVPSRASASAAGTSGSLGSQQ